MDVRLSPYDSQQNVQNSVIYSLHCGSVHCGPVHCGPVDYGPVHCGSVHCGPVDCGPIDCGPVRFTPEESENASNVFRPHYTGGIVL